MRQHRGYQLFMFLGINMPFYKDIALSFDKDPFSEDVVTKVDINSVRQALKVLVLTNPGEKPFDPNFGAGVSGLLQENLCRVKRELKIIQFKNLADSMFVTLMV